MRRTCYWCGEDWHGRGDFHPDCLTSYLESPTHQRKLAAEAERLAENAACDRAETQLDRDQDRPIDDGSQEPDWPGTPL